MASPDDGMDDKPGVTIRCLDNVAVGVRLSGQEPFDEGCVQYVVEAFAPGLTARVDEAVAWIWDADPAAFVARLATDYQGWEDKRVWQTYDGDLAVSAVFRTGGHVGLTWTLRPCPNATGGWTASVTTWLEAGEQVPSLASDVEDFLSGEQP
ncbi:DUF6228 family protein [Streptomyces purpurascens]|uniref:DUF6228 family protein n=1 Tax=Streptomyces purpurascens TaxID=1924 RepID=UPI0033F8F0A6